MSHELMQKQRIRELLDNWVLWRDQGVVGKISQLLALRCAHAGHLVRWASGSFHRSSAARLSIAACTILHALGGSTIDVDTGPSRRADQDDHLPARSVEGVVCDVVCTGRFYDLARRARRPLGHRVTALHL